MRTQRRAPVGPRYSVATASLLSCRTYVSSAGLDDGLDDLAVGAAHETQAGVVREREERIGAFGQQLRPLIQARTGAPEQPAVVGDDRQRRGALRRVVAAGEIRVGRRIRCAERALDGYESRETVFARHGADDVVREGIAGV